MNSEEWYLIMFIQFEFLWTNKHIFAILCMKKDFYKQISETDNLNNLIHKNELNVNQRIN